MLSTDVTYAEKFQHMRQHPEKYPPETRVEIGRLQLALECVVAENHAASTLRSTASRVKDARQKEQSAKITLDEKLAELQTRIDATSDEIQKAEIHVLVVRATADYKKVAAQLQQASTHYDESQRAYELAVEDARKHPISETEP